MKKNNTMRIAVGLAVAALLSTCLVSGTYAKYTTKSEGGDSAQVAKWGVTVAGGNGAFSKTYDETGTVTVKSLTNEVVAPGTNGAITANTLTGKPEVKVAVTNNSKVTLDKWTLDTGTFYCPIKVTIPQSTGADKVIEGITYTDKGQLESDIEAAIDAYTATYDANTDLSTATKVSPAISWEWAFTSGDENDAKDTTLGDHAAQGNSPSISIVVTTTVTQID